jgi:lipopolysaccharide/colanic/teichoic acid biosynthesis glycosyltransferase
VKPGLTGLAQINDASSVNPKTKLNYDLRYVREQSFVYDIKIVTRQLWKVGVDMIDAVLQRGSADE